VSQIRIIAFQKVVKANAYEFHQCAMSILKERSMSYWLFS
jgi:hypothetical protein